MLVSGATADARLTPHKQNKPPALGQGPTFFSSMMLLCFLRWRLLGRFLPFILVLPSFLACWAARAPLLAARAAASFSCLISSGSLRTCAGMPAGCQTNVTELEIHTEAKGVSQLRLYSTV